MNGRFLKLGSESGFTIIEVMVAIFVLVLGILGSIVMIDTGNALTANNKSREGALSLSREIVEAARQTDYDSLSATGAATALQGNAGLADADGVKAGWQVVRRGVTYTVAVTACTYDHPKDGGRATTDTGAYCASSTSPVSLATFGNCAGNKPALPCVDRNPDDFRQLTITSSWTLSGNTRSSTQTVLIVNPTGGIGPRITSVTAVPTLTNNTFGPSTAGTTVTYTVTTGSLASAVNWSASDGTSKGTATSIGTNTWQFVWDLGTAGAAGSVLDGNYTISIQAVSAGGVPGDLNVQTLVVNRVAPRNVTGVEGGRNTRVGSIVDVSWIRNQETDIIGYRVYRVAGLADWTNPGAGDPNDTLVCGTVSNPLDASSCVDPSPPAVGALTYYVKAVDADTAGALRESAGAASSEMTTLDPPPAQPAWPAGTVLSATTVGGVPQLSWNNAAVPDAGRTILFYRIYRDPSSANPPYTERYDTNGGTQLSYEDQDPGASTVHTYTITAVDDSYQESAPLAPFAVSP